MYTHSHYIHTSHRVSVYFSLILYIPSLSSCLPLVLSRVVFYERQWGAHPVVKRRDGESGVSIFDIMCVTRRRTKTGTGRFPKAICTRWDTETKSAPSNGTRMVARKDLVQYSDGRGRQIQLSTRLRIHCTSDYNALTRDNGTGLLHTISCLDILNRFI
jgi:hypothetical protein